MIAIVDEGAGGVLALGLLEGGHAVGDRLDAGQGDGAGREGAQQHDQLSPVRAAPPVSSWMAVSLGGMAEMSPL